MNSTIRSLVFLPIALVSLIFTIALLFSLGNPQIVQGQTILPTSTVPPTQAPTIVPSPTRAPTMPAATPTPRPIPISDSRARANGWILQKVIGNRLSETIYGMALASRLYRSDDNGVTWALVQRNPAVTDFLMSPADPNTLFSTPPIDCVDDVLPMPLYRSDDGGVTWTSLNPGFSMLPLVADPLDKDHVIAAGCDGLYRTEDGGWSWLPLSTLADNALWEEFHALEIAPVYFADGDDPALTNLYTLVADDEGATRLIFSDDGGVTWSEVSPMDVELTFRALAVDQYEIGRVWLSEESGVWSTEDQGQYWGLSKRGLDNALAYGLSDLVLDQGGQLYLGSGYGVYSKDATELLWSKLGNRTIQQQEIITLLYTENAPGQIWLNTVKGVYKLLIVP